MGGGVEPTPTFEMVDLGLPSGLKWAKCNVGAETEEGYGKYFMWGDVEGRTADEMTDKPFKWATSPFNNGASSFDRSYFDAHKSEWLNDDVLKPEYDAATQNMGEGWRMPTKAEFEELLANTTHEWTQVNSINGRRFTGSNGNSIFISAAGYAWDGTVDDQGDSSYVWSSSLNTIGHDNAWSLASDSGYCDVGNSERFGGYSVRGVHS